MRRPIVAWTLGVLMLTRGAAYAARATDLGETWVIETDMYTLHWKLAAQAGYSQAWVDGEEGSLLGAKQARTFYHSDNYGGRWNDWGLGYVRSVEQAPGKVAIETVMFDGLSKEYTCTATYWDGVAYFRHRVVVEAGGDVRSFSQGHEPMVEPHTGTGVRNAYGDWGEPFPHAAFANKHGFFALYTELGTARTHPDWDADGRMDLIHDSLGEKLQDGDRSDPIVYYLAVGAGGLGEAHSLAPDVTTEPSLPVSRRNKLAGAWATLKTYSD
jgi:hypothetical protein